MDSNKDTLNLKYALNDLIAGSFGGCAGILVGHPLDTWKLRLQTGIGSESIGIYQVLVNIIKAEGVGSLFRGLLPPILGNAPLNAIAFGSYGYANRLIYPMLPDSPVNTSNLKVPDSLKESLLHDLRQFSPSLTKEQLDWKSTISSSSSELSLKRIAIAGAFSGFSSAIITTPIELLKCRLQVEGSYKGMVDCASQSIKNYGVTRGLFQGFWATVLRDIPSMAVYFGVYEWVKYFGRSSTFSPHIDTDVPSGSSRNEIPITVHYTHKYDHSVPVLLFAGAMGGMFSWLSTYPIDIVKSIIQTRMVPSLINKNTGILDTTLLGVSREIYQRSGWKGFFRGVTPTCIRAIPVNAVTFFVYENTLQYLNNSSFISEKSL